MNALLGSLVVLGICVTVCNGWCNIIPNSRKAGDSSNACREQNGATHPLNSKWKTKKCDECVCKRGGMNCCSKVPFPVRYDLGKCMKVFHPKTCSYTVVRRNNPKDICPVEQWMT